MLTATDPLFGLLIGAAVLVLAPFVMWFPFWFMCRLTAERCPECGSKWQTELQGEWNGELWKCHCCQCCWET